MSKYVDYKCTVWRRLEMEVYDDNNMIWDNSYQTAINEIENDSK